MRPDLNGKVGIVTGGTKGIGRAVAHGMAEAGASVVIAARTPGEVEAAARELAGVGPGKALGVVCDVRDAEACRNLVQRAVEGFGRVDVLVNNAGIGHFAPIQQMSAEDWRRQIDVNLGGVFHCTKAAIPHLASSGGWVINIGSLASRNSFAGGAGYNASKFGLLGMTEAMMLDLREDGIRVSIIMPGSVSSYFDDHEPGPGDAWKLQPEDVARAVLDVLAYPGNALASRVELRPSRPPKR
jgi:3-oxoacyl-[acyl-carrier protein] reductase